MQATDRGPLLRVVWTDEETEASGFLVIDQLIAGIATGGTRMRAGCTLDEVTDLAREMSLKTAIFGLPVGGAKGGIDYDPGAPDADAVRLRFVQAMRPYLEGTWVTAGDLGTSQPSLDRTFARAGIDDTTLHAALSRFEHPERVRERVTRAFSEVVDGFHMPDLIGGFGVAEAALAGLEQTGTPPGEARAVVQGFGAMGGSSARYLARAGVTVVAIVDSHGMVANTGRGLDVEALLRSRSPDGVVDRSVLRPDDRQLPGEEWLSIDAEVLVPAATSYVITADNCDDVAARLVVEAANVPLTETAEARLRNRDIPVIPAFVAKRRCRGLGVVGAPRRRLGPLHGVSPAVRGHPPAGGPDDRGVRR